MNDPECSLVFFIDVLTVFRGFRFFNGQKRFVINRLFLFFKKVGQSFDFRFGDKGPVNALEPGYPGRQKEHVAGTQQGLGPIGIEDGAGVGFGGDLKRNTGREIGLDDTGQDIH